jgi:membrane protein
VAASKKPTMLSNLVVKAKKILFIHFVIDVMARFGRNNGGLLAAGLAFFLVIAFVPLLLVGIAVLGFLIHRPDDAMIRIQQLLTTQILPGAAGDEVMHLIKDANIEQTVVKIQATRSASGIVGILGLVWASMQIYINGSTAMNAAFETPETRSWIKLRIIALELLISTGVLLVLSIAATAYGSYLTKALAYLPGEARLMSFSTEIGAMIFSSIMYAMVYKFLHRDARGRYRLRQTAQRQNTHSARPH